MEALLWQKRAAVGSHFLNQLTRNVTCRYVRRPSARRGDVWLYYDRECPDASPGDPFTQHASSSRLSICACAAHGCMLVTASPPSPWCDGSSGNIFPTLKSTMLGFPSYKEPDLYQPTYNSSTSPRTRIFARSHTNYNASAHALFLIYLMSTHFNPFVQSWRMGNASSSTSASNPSGEVPSIFGALPGGSPSRAQSSPPLPDATVFHITAFRPNILNASIVDARGRSCYRIVTDPSQPLRTAYYDARRRTVAVIDWSGEQPSVEMPGLAPRQSIRSWLRALPDRASRWMEVRSVQYIWVPEGVYITLYQAQSQSQRLARVYVSGDDVKVELSQQAMQAHLADVSILCATIFLSGRNID